MVSTCAYQIALGMVMDRKVLLLISGIGLFALCDYVARGAAPRPPADVLEEEDHAPRPGSLPLVLNYKGREADAPWRKEAEARIEKFRKGDIAVVVNDASGNPVAGADVAIKIKRQAFSWGAATRA